MTRVNEKKRKLTLIGATFLMCLALMLAGTYAWQSISQTVLNEAMGGIRNPGGRLHDDFNGTNKDIYVENFMGENEGQSIIVRIRLFEHMEIGENAGNPDNRAGVTVLTKDAYGDETDITNVGTWHLHEFGETTAAHDYWTWEMGGQTTYMPTFNKNKDSLKADVNGTYEGTTPGDNIHYDDYKDYAANPVKKGIEIHDADDNDEDEEKLGKPNILGQNYTESAEMEHTARPTLDAEVISMEEWLSPTGKNGALGNYWVYDEDGWAYWANELEGGTATGLLLDKIILGDIDQLWYYGIYVECQMVTADEIADTDAAKEANPGKGFYHKHEGGADAVCTTCLGECPGSNAEALLAKIIEKIGYTATTGSTGTEAEANQEITENKVNEAYAAYLADLRAEEELQLLSQEEETEPDTETEQTELEELEETDETEGNELTDEDEDETSDGDDTQEDTKTEDSAEEPDSDAEKEDSTTEEDTTDKTGNEADDLQTDDKIADETTGDTITGNEENTSADTQNPGGETNETNPTETTNPQAPL